MGTRKKTTDDAAITITAPEGPRGLGKTPAPNVKGRGKKAEEPQAPPQQILVGPDDCPECGHPKNDHVMAGSGKHAHTVCMTFGCEAVHAKPVALAEKTKRVAETPQSVPA